jgi:hypothetical protein
LRRCRSGGRRLIIHDDLARRGHLLPGQDRLQHFAVDARFLAFHPHADGAQLEHQVLVRDAHHFGEVCDPNL